MENELMIHNNTAIVRTPDTIATEINSIKAQTRTVILTSSIEIGRRLVEAKSLLDHGEWGEWLEERVAYSKSTANNLMRIFDEYGSLQITMLDDNAMSPAFQRLGYTQAVALLGLPAEDREAFITENPVEDMTTRELQQAIRERDQARQEKDAAEMNLSQALRRALLAETNLEEAGEENAAEVETAKERAREADEARKKAERALTDAIQKGREESEKNAAELNAKLVAQTAELIAKQEAVSNLEKKLRDSQSKPMEVNPGATEEDIAALRADIVAEYEKKLTEAEAAARAAEAKAKELQALSERKVNEDSVKFRAHFETLTNVFGLLLGSIESMKTSDAALAQRHQAAVVQLLDKMRERV